ncbi:hypothetical protein [Moorena sp. SIO3H5]|uniref:hypothetical protein n=1 Tax=Moorena sp. SIO3H5 TaxID=2607834 RepID=UPI0013BCC8B4|nr:hypothetical protein [Moorena sp. SIO3H5]NEO74090.1 hypothetical protein [Moorena sp. SIO3H5]
MIILSPPKFGGGIIPINLPCQTYFCSRFPIPDSQFLILNSLLPTPYSLLPTP